jgi:hypothetical protein
VDYAAGSASDFLVLRATGIESEMELGFAGLHRLVLPLLSGMEFLPEPQRRALASAVGLIEGATPDLFLVGLATLTLLSEAANDRAVLCVVDDAQWLDRTSADVLAFIARRMNADRVAFLFGVREPSGERLDLEGLRSLRVSGLNPEDARRLVQELNAGRRASRLRSDQCRGRGQAFHQREHGRLPPEAHRPKAGCELTH